MYSNTVAAGDLFPGWTAAEGEAFAVRKEARFRERAASQLASLTTPGLQELCARLSAAGVRCAAVTNAPRANAELMLHSLGTIAGVPAIEHFSPLVIGDECVHAKPHPEPYLAAMRALGVRPESCLAFEDSPSGASAAVCAGVRTIGILSTQPASVLTQAGCSLLVRDFADAALAQELSTWARV